MYFLWFSVIAIVCTVLPSHSEAVCRSGTSNRIRLEFDEIRVDSTYKELPVPYRGFNLTRLQGRAGKEASVMLMNVSGVPIGGYQNAATSYPNIVFTNGETLRISRPGGRLFSVESLWMKSVFRNNQAILIETYRQFRLLTTRQVFLPMKRPVELIINVSSMDRLLISCTNSNPNTCGHMTFDDITLCAVDDQ